MNYGGFGMFGPNANWSLIMMIKPRVLKALLYANFSVFCNYLHGHDMPVQDFLTDEDMEDAKHNLFNN